MRAFADVAGLIWGRTTGVPGLVPAAQLSGVCTRSSAPGCRASGELGAEVIGDSSGGAFPSSNSSTSFSFPPPFLTPTDATSAAVSDDVSEYAAD